MIFIVRKKVQKKLYIVSDMIETTVGVIVMVPIALSVIGLLVQIFSANFFETGQLFIIIEHTIEIIIAIEFIKLIFIHTMDTTIELIIMAVVRQIIVEHSSYVATLVLIVAILLLFVVRKLLFVPKLDNIEEDKDDKKIAEDV